ncbi:hypothetical protein KQX54_008883 [Cotesia glomerata]|uniref:Uncharacterized protein n=1 Tax=Cotesia glomerata TaxID=32391 RepID=A0AAV7HZ28_COTGL|nr:hypothetical protein KQX54_008883 [Cotesia glomerata]
MMREEYKNREELFPFNPKLESASLLKNNEEASPSSFEFKLKLLWSVPDNWRPLHRSINASTVNKILKSKMNASVIMIIAYVDLSTVTHLPINRLAALNIEQSLYSFQLYISTRDAMRRRGEERDRVRERNYGREVHGFWHLEHVLKLELYET